MPPPKIPTSDAQPQEHEAPGALEKKEAIPGAEANMSPDIQAFWKSLVGESQLRVATDILFNHGKIFLRLDRDITRVEQHRDIALAKYEEAVMSLLPNKRHTDELAGPDGATDFALTLFGQRLRANIYRTLGGLCAALRPLQEVVFSMEKLQLTPKILDIVVKNRQGLIIVSGPTGSGKSTTISGMVDHLNSRFSYNIITIEDPIEFIYKPKQSIVSQREVGEHVGSFDRALRSAMRQNPDVIVVGEMRDYATVKATMQAAETGHLVFATLHTRRVFTTISRIVEMAPVSEMGELRSLLANNLIMVMCQRLLKRKGGGIIPCREIVIQNTAVSNAIRNEREKELNNIMLTHRGEGMIDWHSALNDLEAQALVAAEEAIQYRDEDEKHI